MILLKLNLNELKTDQNCDPAEKNCFCALCLDEIDLNKNLIVFSSNNYHNRCINFWLNQVDEFNFPNLKINNL